MEVTNLFANGSKLIGLCLAGVDEEYNDAFLRAFSSHSSDYGFKLICFYSFSSLDKMDKHDLGESYIYNLINFDMLDGLIILSESIKTRSVTLEIVKQANRHNIPVVSVDHYIDSCYNISFNYEKAMAEIVTHLVEVHHYKTFNFIAGIKGNDFSEKRYNIFLDVLHSHGLEFDERRLGYGQFWAEPTIKVMEKFLNDSLPLPEAIVCANDSMTCAAFNCLVEAGLRVPEDVAVTGFDGIDMALNHQPVLTTAVHAIDETATSTFDTLLDIFNKKEPLREKWVDSRILIGGSCGCLSKQTRYFSNRLTKNLYDRINYSTQYIQMQINMTADLSDNENFSDVFENIKKYTYVFDAEKLMLCIDDVFLLEEELSDILDDINVHKISYSPKTDLMLFREHGVWNGMTDFETKDLLPNLETIMSDVNCLLFFPLHVHQNVIGYTVLSYDNEPLIINHAYEFFMNVSNALEMTKSRIRQQKIIDSLEKKYIHDPMTGLFNRRGFYQRIENVFHECITKGKRIAIVSADLNGLKFINDTYGHADGDIAISTVGHILDLSAIYGETSARFGGDEFVVAGEVPDDIEDYEAEFRSRVNEALDTFNGKSHKNYKVSTSLGIVVGTPSADLTLDDFIKVADEKMYEEKAKCHMNRL